MKAACHTSCAALFRRIVKCSQPIIALVSSDMIVYTVAKERGGMPPWVTIVSLVVILVVMLLVVACIALLLANGKRARGSNEFKLLSVKRSQLLVGF